MGAQTRLVSVRKATQMAFTEGAVLKVLQSLPLSIGDGRKAVSTCFPPWIP
jgi:hypothetical protein